MVNYSSEVTTNRWSQCLSGLFRVRKRSQLSRRTNEHSPNLAKRHLVALTRELHPTSQLVPEEDHRPLQDKARKLQLYVLRQVKTESLVQQRVSRKTLKSPTAPDSLGTASTFNTAFCPYHRKKSHDLEDCQKFRELDFSGRKDVRSKKDCALTAQAQTRTSANTVIKVVLNAKYAERIMSQPFTTRRGQKTTPVKLHPPVLKYAKTDPVVPVVG